MLPLPWQDVYDVIRVAKNSICYCPCHVRVKRTLWGSFDTQNRTLQFTESAETVFGDGIVIIL